MTASERKQLATKAIRGVELVEEVARRNDSLAATGSEPVTHPDLHASQLANYVVEHEVLILEALRNQAIERVSRREPEPHYQQWRDGLRAMLPDQAWLPIHHFVPDPALADHVQTWLTSLGAPRLTGVGAAAGARGSR